MLQKLPFIKSLTSTVLHRLLLMQQLLKIEAEMLQRAGEHNILPQSLFVMQKSDISLFIWTKMKSFKQPRHARLQSVCLRSQTGHLLQVQRWKHWCNTRNGRPLSTRRGKKRKWSEVKSPHVSTWSDMQPKFKFSNICGPFKTKLHKTK